MTRVLGCLLLLILPVGGGDIPIFAANQGPSGNSDQAPRKTGGFLQAEFTGVRVGFAGQYKTGVWTPVEVAIRGGTRPQMGHIRMTVSDGDGVPSRVVSPPDDPCLVLPDRVTTQQLFVRFGRVDGTLRVEFVVDGKVAARREFTTAPEPGPTQFSPAVPALQPLIVSVGATVAGIEDAVALRQADPTREDVVAHVPDFRQLPERWYGYDGVKAVVLSTSRPESFDELSLASVRLDALDRWVRLGGRLVMFVGSAGDKLLAPGAPLTRFAPGSLAEMVVLRQLGALEAYAGGSAPVPAPEQDRALSVPRLKEVEGVVELREADLPLVVRTPRGFGQIIFVAADLDLPPLSQWRDRRLVLAKLLDLPVTRADDKEQDFSVMHFGYDDLSGQLRSALHQFRGVHFVPFGLIAAAIVLYIAWIGPGDFFFLKRILRRMDLTWITFPAAVLAVSLTAYAMAHWLKGSELRMNQADVVDVDVPSGRVRGTTWFSLFSPRIDTFDLTVEPQPSWGIEGPMAPGDAETLLGWLGLPGRALGGMNPRAQGPALWTDPYVFSPDLSAMLHVPIQAWSAKSFTARWQATAPKTLAAELVRVDEAPTGTIKNMLDVPLTDCLLAYGTWAYRLGDLAPGQTFRLAGDAPRSELRTVLTGRRYVQEEKTLRQRVTPYDRSSDDPEYILNAMLFHGAAGGTRYTDLSNAYQPFIDLSSLLKAGRAILVARIEHDGRLRRASEVRRGNEPIAGPDDQYVGVYRFVLPVENKATEVGR